MDLEIEHRENWSGVKCVAPFINGWHVWDIPEKEWTHAVQMAVMHAYEIGWKHCLSDMNENMRPPNMPRDWSAAALRGEGEE